MRFRLASVSILAVAAITACADEPTSARSGPSFASAAAESKTYVILGTGNSLPENFAATVAAAGGAVTGEMGGIGVAVATSSDPAFASKMSKAQGVHAVAEDQVIDFGSETVAGEVEVEASADPGVGAMAVGAIETFRAVQWAPDAISAPAAWDLGYMGAGARVAIIDGGIRNTHIDIAPNLDAARSASFVPGQPYNFDQARNTAGQCVLNDTFWHGTHVAGIVAAPANNIGTVGIAPQATIIGVKALHCGSGAFSWIMNAIYYASTPIAEGGAGANIINMSLGAGIAKGGAGTSHLLNALSRATAYARQRGVTVIASAGNDATDIDHTANLVFVPGMSVGVITISALGPMGWALGSTDLDRPASYTN
jgi:hypothetical protein